MARDAEPKQLVTDRQLLRVAVRRRGFARRSNLDDRRRSWLPRPRRCAAVGGRAARRRAFVRHRVTPGDAAVRRNADQMVTAQLIGLQTDKVRLYARYQSASKWEQVAMQPQQGASGFQFLFAGLPEGVEYYVEAGPLHSRHFNLRVVDLPTVKQIRVTYHFPSWTGMQSTVGRARRRSARRRGHRSELEVQIDRPLRDGVLVLNTDRRSCCGCSEESDTSRI